MSLKGKRVLVTGADGFIGSHLVEALVNQGAKVKAFVYYNSFNSWGWLDTIDASIKRKIEVFTGDIRDPNGVFEATQRTQVIFHLAALIGIPFSYHSPDSYVDTNIKGTLNILQAAKKGEVGKIIHTSTSEVYGTAQYVPIDEKHPICPQSPYAATKSAADDLALSFYKSFQLPVAIARPFNTFGPRQSARAVIPTIISQIYAGKTAITLGNTTAIRDMNYVTNTVDGFIALATSPKTEGEVFNIGSGQAASIAQLVEMIQQITKTKIKIVTDRTRYRPAKSEVERLMCNANKLKKKTGWKPQVSLLQGLQKTCEWVSQNMAAFKTDIYNV